MPQIDQRRTIARQLIHSAFTMLAAAEGKALDPSDKKIVTVATRKLATLARSLSSTAPLDDDAAAAKLSVIATSLMNCNSSDLKRGVYAEVTKAAKIFDAMSQGL
jgi:hypothetical protein